MAFKAELLRKKLKEEGKKRADLATATRRNVRTVSRWLTGENAPKTKDLEAISRVLNCRPQDFDPFFADMGLGEVSIQAHVSTASHNAYEVMRWRYGVSQKQLMELAPVLFAIVAGHALKVPEQDAEHAREAHRLGLSYPLSPEHHIHEQASERRKCFGLKPKDPMRDHPQNLFCEAVRRLSSHIGDNVDTQWFVGAEPQDAPTAAGYIPDVDLLEKITGGDWRLVEAIVKGRIRLSKCRDEVFQNGKSFDNDDKFLQAFAVAVRQERDKQIEEQRKAGLKKLDAWRAFYAERHPDMAQEYDDLVAQHCHEEQWYPKHYTEDDRVQSWIDPFKEDRHINENSLPEYQQRKAAAEEKDKGAKTLTLVFPHEDPVYRRFEELKRHRSQLKKQFEEVWA